MFNMSYESRAFMIEYDLVGFMAELQSLPLGEVTDAKVDELKKKYGLL